MKKSRSKKSRDTVPLSEKYIFQSIRSQYLENMLDQLNLVSFQLYWPVKLPNLDLLRGLIIEKTAACQ